MTTPPATLTGELGPGLGQGFALDPAGGRLAEPPGPEADAGEGRARLEKVAFRVMDEINSATPISATSLAGFALLGAHDRAYTLAEIEAILAPLLDYIRRRELPGPDPALCRGVGLTQTLRVLAGNGVVSCFDGGSEPVWSIVPDNHAVAAGGVVEAYQAVRRN